MEFLEALNDLAAGIGLERIVLDDTGSVTLLFDGVHAISFTPDDTEEAVYFQSEIADTSSLAEGDFRKMLEASLTDTNGAAFSINRPLEKIVLWKRFGEFSSRSALENAINEFLGQVARWKEKLAKGDFGANASSSSPAPTVFSGGFITV